MVIWKGWSETVPCRAAGHPFSSPLCKNSRNTVYKLRFANVLGRINGDLKRGDLRLFLAERLWTPHFQPLFQEFSEHGLQITVCESPDNPCPSFPCLISFYQGKPPNLPRIFCPCRTHKILGKDRENTKTTKEIPCLQFTKEIQTTKERKDRDVSQKVKRIGRFSDFSDCLAIFLRNLQQNFPKDPAVL